MARNTSGLTPAELDFWERAFLKAEGSLLSSHDGRLAEKAGLPRICGDIARGAVEQRRSAARGLRKARRTSR